LAKAFIAVDISLNGRNFELKRKLAHGNTAKSQGWCPTFGVQSRVSAELVGAAVRRSDLPAKASAQAPPHLIPADLPYESSGYLPAAR
ncbi:hypothetical protein, partial [Pseudomonas sp. GL-R-19]|uniref:hypothetical protein n=1 Tax=Pseudomonas sp. GL-R-19 TaxID=2832391 RepID=UPI001CBEE356